MNILRNNVENIATLGYHSHTGWAVHPQILLLYDKLEMNQANYEAAIARGEEKESTFAYIVSRLLQEYRREGLLVLKDYEKEITAEDKDLVNEIVDRWIATIPDKVINLCYNIYSVMADVSRKRLKYAYIGEPTFKDFVRDVETYTSWLQRLRQKGLISSDREIVKHYLEHVIFSKKLLSKPHKPVFDWESCSKLREWLISGSVVPRPVRQDELQQLKETTKVKTLSTLIEILVEHEEILDDKQLHAFLKKRKKLNEVRTQVENMNRRVWNFINRRSDRQSYTMDAFVNIVKPQIDRLHEELESVELEKKAFKRSPLNKIITTATGFLSFAGNIISTILVPVLPSVVTGSVEKGTSVVGYLGKRGIEKKYADLRWCSIYQHIYEDSLMKRTNIRIKLDSYGSGVTGYTETEICTLLGINRHTLYRCEEMGLLPGVTRDRWARKIYTDKHVETLMQWLTSTHGNSP